MNKRQFIAWCEVRLARELRILTRIWKKMLTFGILTLIIGLSIGSSVKQKKLEKEVAAAQETVRQEEQKKIDALQKKIDALQEETDDAVAALPWYLVLVNRDHPMEEGYVPDLTELANGYSVDARILDAAKEMLADAKKEGLHVQICSAYRSVNRQEQIFNDSVKDRLNTGMGYWDAYQETSMSVAVPGTSEHALGLALDLISNQYIELDEGQAETEEAKWLAENCYKYGFILRYPPDKTEITGIIYEPWHYRYVGVEDATKIHELNITLEEYLEEYY